jgi:hypothetical protein
VLGKKQETRIGAWEIGERQRKHGKKTEIQPKGEKERYNPRINQIRRRRENPRKKRRETVWKKENKRKYLSREGEKG